MTRRTPAGAPRTRRTRRRPDPTRGPETLALRAGRDPGRPEAEDGAGRELAERFDAQARELLDWWERLDADVAELWDAIDRDLAERWDAVLAAMEVRP